MNPLIIKNADGDTIQIKFDADGVIQICHSDIDPNGWGVLHEYDKQVKQPGLQGFLKNKGIDLSDPITAGLLKQATPRFGGYIVLQGNTFSVGAEEVAQIHAAVKQAGGIVPNWSSQP